jgi:hypothetical protein
MSDGPSRWHHVTLAAWTRIAAARSRIGIGKETEESPRGFAIIAGSSFDESQNLVHSRAAASRQQARFRLAIFVGRQRGMSGSPRPSVIRDGMSGQSSEEGSCIFQDPGRLRGRTFRHALQRASWNARTARAFRGG